MFAKMTDFAMKLLVSQHPPIAGLAFPNDSGLIAARAGKMTIKAILGDVELGADEPLGKRWSPIQHLRPFLSPNQVTSLLGPKFLR